MALNIDWGCAIAGAVVGWIASGKVDEAQQKFSTTIAAGSAAGVKAAMKAQAKKLAKAKKKGAGNGGNTGNGKNGQG